jgi:probable HAF family extracellular repeat protein
LGNDINDTGQIAGGTMFSPAFVWNTASSTTTQIPDVNGNDSEGIFAWGINSRGAAVGHGWNFRLGGPRSFLWQPDTANGPTGTVVALNNGVIGTQADAINASGQIAGVATGVGAFVWNPTVPNSTTGSMHPLGLLSGYTQASPTAINDAGSIVGTAQGGGPSSRAFIWRPDSPNGTTGAMTNLGVLPTTVARASAADVNNLGAVVGTSGSGISDIRAFVWTEAEGMLDLNGLLDVSGSGWRLLQAAANNDAGQIAGWGYYDPDGPGGLPEIDRAFVLTPIPEPALGVVVFGAACAVRHRRRSWRRAA